MNETRRPTTVVERLAEEIMNETRRPRRKLTLKDRLDALDARAARYGELLEGVARERAALIEAERAKAEAILAELTSAAGIKPALDAPGDGELYVRSASTRGKSVERTEK